MELSVEEKQKICDLFNEVGDKEALQRLHELTEDKIVDIALNWLDVYESKLAITYSHESAMYQDIIEYIYETILN